MKPATIEAYNLLHNGLLALSHVEANGMRVDLDYVRRAARELEAEAAKKETELREDIAFRLWRKRFGTRTNLRSRDQLRHVLFDPKKHGGMGLPVIGITKSKKAQVNEEVLRDLDLPFVSTYLELEKINKCRGTFLEGILRETLPCKNPRYGYLRTFYNLHTVVTYRGSSDSPNVQNFPLRDPVYGAIVRRAFVPRSGHHLVEIDYGGVEVRVSACYNKDQRLIDDICNPKNDMHRDMAAMCYKLPKAEVSKRIRYCGKNMFVFPEFYGDLYLSCAKSLWKAVERMGLKLESGQSLREHLTEVGFTELGRLDIDEQPLPGTFEEHIRKVEKHFWTRRYPDYAQWKRDWCERYVKRGWVHTYTGFTIEGEFKRNQIINYPIQGSAFHCLLWTLIELDKEITRRGMRTRIIGQIHDSIIADVPPEELEEFTALAQEIATQRIRKHWKWITVPLEVEAEVAPIDKPWYDKEKYALN